MDDLCLMMKQFLAARHSQCVAMTRAIVLDKLLLHNVYCVIVSKQSWYSIVLLSPPAVHDLKWWLDAFKSWNGVLFVSRPVDIQVATDVHQSDGEAV